MISEATVITNDPHVPCRQPLPKSNHYISKHSVIHIQTAFPEDLSWINAKGISLLDVIIKKGC